MNSHQKAVSLWYLELTHRSGLAQNRKHVTPRQYFYFEHGQAVQILIINLNLRCVS